MSLPTTWIWKASPGWKIICSPTPGAVLIVSHDRYFLDTGLSPKWLRSTSRTRDGSFSRQLLRLCLEKKAQLRDELSCKALPEPAARRSSHQEAVIAKLKSFNREKSIRRAESREKMLDKDGAFWRNLPRSIPKSDALTLELDNHQRQ